MKNKLEENPNIEIVEINSHKKNSNDIDFPVNQLNDSNFKKHLLHLDSTSGSPVEFLLLALLCSISGTVGKKFYFQASEKVKLFFNLWGCIVGQSTITRKTSALSLAAWDLARIEKKNFAEYKKEKDQYDSLSNDDKKVSQAPKRKYLLLPSDSTLESLSSILAESERGLIQHSELSSFLGQMNKSYATDSKPTLTALYDVPEVFEISRKTSGSTILERPYFTLIAASTKSWLKKDTNHSDASGGFLARFLFCCRETNPKKYVPYIDIGKQSFKSPYYVNAREIYESLSSQSLETEIKFTLAAENVIREKDIQFFNEKIISCKDENLTSSLSRLSVSIYKIAGLLALFNGRFIIDVADVEDAYLIGGFFYQNAKIIFDELRERTTFELKEKKLYDIIKKECNKKGYCTLTDTKSSGLYPKEKKEIISNLVEMELLKEENRKIGESRKATKVYILLNEIE